MMVGVKSLQLFPVQLHLFQEFTLNKWQLLRQSKREKKKIKKRMVPITGLMFFTLNMRRRKPQ